MADTSHNHINILLVDDNPTNIDVLETILKKNGRTFFRADSGEKAIEIISKNNIGLMMLDVQMGGMNGFEVADILKHNEATKDISIIFVTGVNKSVAFAEKGFDQGAVDYLYKPLDLAITKKKVQVFETIYFQQKELKKSNEEILRINKQLDQFAYIVSHDLKAPLRGINSLVGWIQEDLTKHNGQATATVTEYLELIHNRVVRMDELIAGALDYSRVSRKNEVMQKIDLNDLIKEIVDLFLIPESVKINICKDMPVLNSEKQKLIHVFQNVIDNAIKYNDKPETIIDINCSDKGRFYRFDITDNGMGIRKEDLERVFDIFQTTKSVEETNNSTGVGLAIVKRLVEDKGGNVSAQSELGKNTTISLTWPKEG